MQNGSRVKTRRVLETLEKKSHSREICQRNNPAKTQSFLPFQKGRSTSIKKGSIALTGGEYRSSMEEAGGHEVGSERLEQNIHRTANSEIMEFSLEHKDLQGASISSGVPQKPASQPVKS